MTESVHQDLPASRPSDCIEIRTTEEQALVIHRAAALLGWTVPQYVLSAILDRAERDLYEHAAADQEPGPSEQRGDTAEPFVALITALG